MKVLNVRVIPNAKKNGVSDVRIIRGEKSREKVVEIRCRSSLRERDKIR